MPNTNATVYSSATCSTVPKTAQGVPDMTDFLAGLQVLFHALLALTASQQALLCGSQMSSSCTTGLASRHWCVILSWPMHVPGCETASLHITSTLFLPLVQTPDACRSKRQSSLPASLGAGKGVLAASAWCTGLAAQGLGWQHERTANLLLVWRRQLAWIMHSTTPPPWRLCSYPSTLPGTP